MTEVALMVLFVGVVVAGAGTALAWTVAAKLARIERRLRRIERDRRLENDRRLRELVKAIPPRRDTDFRSASSAFPSNSVSNVHAIPPKPGHHASR
jgi:hypothetical protein